MKVHIENYQRIKEADIDVLPGITAIVGKSDHGKSAIGRAIRWFCFNRPLGNSFIRKGTDKVVVSIDNIAHFRLKTKNYYEVDGELAESEKSAAICGITEVNFQGQHDTPFLLRESAGEVARSLALLIDLTKPQNLLKKVKSNSTKLNAQRDSLILLKDKYDSELNSYIGLVKYSRRFADIEAKMARIQTWQGLLATLAAALENATEARTRLDTIPQTEGLIKTGNRLLQAIENTHNRSVALNGVHNSLQMAIDKNAGRTEDRSELLATGRGLHQGILNALRKQRALENLQLVLRKARKLNVLFAKANGANSLLTLVKDKSGAIRLLIDIDESVQDVTFHESSVKNCVKAENRAKRALAVVKKDMGVCPFCGGTPSV